MTAVIFWSAGNLIVRGSDLAGSQIAFWRFLVAAIVYCIVHVLVVGPLLWSDFKRAAPTGLVIALEIVAFFVALKHTTVANVTIIGNLVPLLLFGVAARRFSERVPVRVVLATIVALIGVIAVVYGAPQDRSFNAKGDGLAVVALFLFAGYFWLAKEARQTMSTFTLQTHSMLAGIGPIALIFLIDSGGFARPQGGQWSSVLALVAFPGTGHLLMNWAHGHVTLTLASLTTIGVPVISVIGAYFLFDESLVWIQVAGLALVLAVLSFAIVETNRLLTER